MNIRIPVVREGEAYGLPLPGYQTVGAVGMDLYAAEDTVICPGQCISIGTGLRIAVPQGYEAQIRARSGLALKRKIIIPNGPGTIDSDYRGEIRVILMNLGDRPFAIDRGDRIAQMVLAPVVRGFWEEVDELDTTVRGLGGFGSTGGAAVHNRREGQEDDDPS
ncbi:MAG: dUTP diphosphatase [Dethiosulfovibrio peptidovorans]|nr:MAG: dUTP diphosphatase [Dethiosulfovibrio peptidovorans]